MPGLLPILFLGVILGMRHATDADHVVAVTTIVTRQRSVADAMRIGALWGVGHTLTILLVGGAIIVLGVVIPPRLGLAMEFAVAVMLVGLGAYSLLGRRGAAAQPSAARPMLVGVVHGLAGSAAIALLVLTTIPEPRWALGYLLLFGLGTIGGMMGVTGAVAAPMALTVRRFDRFNRSLQLVSGTLSVALGLALAAQLALVDGLFAATPTWVPR
ncbi:MAG: high-affinity nickel-transport family protein [Bacillota bacterium]|jgi:high-affinity nickel-transport protein